MAHLLDRCGTPRQPTAMSIERRHPAAAERPRPIYSVACSSGRGVHFPYRCDTPRPTDRDVHRATAPRGSRTPAAGFAPPTRHARPLIFSPYATHRRQISSYKFLLSPPLFPVAAPHRPSAPRGRPSPSGHRGGLLLIPFRSTAARLQRAFFFIFRFCPFSPLRPPPFRHPPPWRCPVRRSAAVPPRPPPRSPRNPDCAAVCPHPFTPFIPPIARAPRL